MINTGGAGRGREIEERPESDISEDAKQNCGFVRGKDLFRLRAAGIILRDRHVLMAVNEQDPYYYSVGGAVHLGESVQEAVVREVLEETGTQMEADRLAFIHENFFTGNDGLDWHEVAFYFLMKVPFGFAPRDGSLSMSGVSEHMVWLPVDRFNEYKAFPSFFARELPHLGEGVRHVVTRESPPGDGLKSS